MQRQSQHVQNLISLMQYGICSERKDKLSFIYQRIDTDLDDTLKIKLDDTDTNKLSKLAEKAAREFQIHRSIIIENYCV